VLKIINHKNILFLLVFIIIALGSPLAFNDNYVLAVFFYSLALFFYYKKTLDLVPIVVVFFWILINVFSYNYNETNLNYYTLLGYIVKILLPYFTLKVIGYKLFDKFSDWVYYLTLVSLVIYILRVAFPFFFSSLTPIFTPLTAEVYREQGWYGFIFTYNHTHLRNCGFMWEPGALAMVIIITLINYLYRNNFKINFRIIILVISLLVTFSTMGYFSLLVILVLYVLHEKKYMLLFLSIPILLLFAQDIYQLDFISGKINDYLQNLDRHYYVEQSDSYKINRFSMFLLSIQETMKYPFGYGAVPSKSILLEYGESVKGAGGVSELLRMWGVIGLVFLTVSIYKYYDIFITETKKIFKYLALIVILFAFFSNPVEKSPLPFFFFFFPFIFCKKIN